MKTESDNLPSSTGLLMKKFLSLIEQIILISGNLNIHRTFNARLSGIVFIIPFIFFSRGDAQTTVVDSIYHDGLWRNYRLFLPTGYTFSDELPLVFNLHGYTSNAWEQEVYSGFNAVADTAKVIVCYPNGIANAWNAFSSTGVDDVGFIDTLITLFHSQYNVNLNRVYSTGLSNGGFMSFYLACNLANRFAAIADVAGGMVIPVQLLCNPSKKIPALHIHGTADPVVAYGGGLGVLSVPDLMNFWADKSACSSITDTVAVPDIVTSDLCTAEIITWEGCEVNNSVIHYRVIGGGHTWPGTPIIIGVTNEDFNASVVIWNFFNQFTSTGIQTPPASNAIRLYPNPVADHLNFSIDNFKQSNPFGQIEKLQIVNLHGKVVLEESFSSEKIGTHEIDVSVLGDGIYLLTIFGSEGNLMKMFVKQ